MKQKSNLSNRKNGKKKTVNRNITKGSIRVIWSGRRVDVANPGRRTEERKSRQFITMSNNFYEVIFKI